MCTFEIPVAATAAIFVEKVRSQVEANGGTFQGDLNAGDLDLPTPLGRVVGDYRIDGNTVTINISKKPFIVSCNQIRSYLVSHL